MSRYDIIGHTYSGRRRPDPRIARVIASALGGAESVVNVGAGAGSYEPSGRAVVAVEPSAVMIAQRPATAAPAVRGSAEKLPFSDNSFDAALAVLTVHHWSDQRAGLAELRRVARDRVVILTWDPAHPGFWLVRDYFPDLIEFDRRIFPTLADLEAALGHVEVAAVPVPHDCVDGFLGAYWRRPGEYLDGDVRSGISTFARIGDLSPGLDRLRADLVSGRWAMKNAELLRLDRLDLGVSARCQQTRHLITAHTRGPLATPSAPLTPVPPVLSFNLFSLREIPAGRRVWVWSRRRIRAGEEITVDCGREYFDGHIRPRGCRCAACGRRR